MLQFLQDIVFIALVVAVFGLPVGRPPQAALRHGALSMDGDFIPILLAFLALALPIFVAWLVVGRPQRDERSTPARKPGS